MRIDSTGLLKSTSSLLILPSIVSIMSAVKVSSVKIVSKRIAMARKSDRTRQIESNAQAYSILIPPSPFPILDQFEMLPFLSC